MIYIITYQDNKYREYDIHSVYTNKAAAEQEADRLSEDSWDYLYGVETYPVVATSQERLKSETGLV
jgi:hypothetical protein